MYMRMHMVARTGLGGGRGKNLWQWGSWKIEIEIEYGRVGLLACIDKVCERSASILMVYNSTIVPIYVIKNF